MHIYIVFICKKVLRHFSFNQVLLYFCNRIKIFYIVFILSEYLNYYINHFKYILLTISRSISKGKQLSEFKKGPVDILKHQGLNMCQISGIIGRSRCVCRNYIENAEKYGQNKRNPRKSKLSPRT